MVRHHYQRELLSLGYPFADVLAKAALSPQLFIGRGLSQRSLARQTGLLPNSAYNWAAVHVGWQSLINFVTDSGEK